MTTADNENEPLPFQSLAQIAARLLATDAKKNEYREGDGARADDNQQHGRQQRDYVAQRLRELATFERRARGTAKSR